MGTADYRELMRSWPSGVAVVAALDSGSPEGCTVSGFVSVGVAPPLVLVSLADRSRTRSAVLKTRRFSVNVLAASQAAVAERFAAPGLARRFDDVPHRIAHGAPLLDGAVSFVVCEYSEHVVRSGHTLVFGVPVAGARRRLDVEPLVYVEGAWHTSVPLAADEVSSM